MVSTNKLINSFKQMEKAAGELRVPIATEMYLPNHSGDHSAGIVLKTPSNDQDIANKAYVDASVDCDYLGTIDAVSVSTALTAVGSLNFAAGTFEDGDILEIFCYGYNTTAAGNMYITITDGVSTTLASINCVQNGAGGTDYGGTVVIQQMYQDVSRLHMMLRGVRGTTAVNRQDSTDLTDNWITGVWGVEILMSGDDGLGAHSPNYSSWKLYKRRAS